MRVVGNFPKANEELRDDTINNIDTIAHIKDPLGTRSLSTKHIKIFSEAKKEFYGSTDYHAGDELEPVAPTPQDWGFPRTSPKKHKHDLNFSPSFKMGGWGDG